jgi:propanol-preferring alcohol dehydrogenase
MKAARLHEYGKPLQIDDVPVPEIKKGEVLVRMAGAYVCSSDLNLIRGAATLPRIPITLGHNNAGYVEKAGADVIDLKEGDPVAVFGGWGCGHCRFCRQGEEQLCNMMTWVGFGMDGGYAQYLHVPEYRHLIKLDALDPVEAAPLIDAGLTPYRAIKKTLPFLYPGGTAVILGVGNLGGFAVKIMKAISPGSRVIAVDVREERLQAASELGAENVVKARGNVGNEIKKLTGGEGAQAIIDTVGSDETLKTAAAAVGRKGIIVLVGLARGTLPYSFFGLPWECVVTNSQWGSYTELEELLSLASDGKVRARIQRFSLDEINEVFQILKKGQIQDQAVITPCL